MFISALLTYFGLYCSESGNTVMSTLATVTMLISVGAVHETPSKVSVWTLALSHLGRVA